MHIVEKTFHQVLDKIGEYDVEDFSDTDYDWPSELDELDVWDGPLETPNDTVFPASDVQISNEIARRLGRSAELPTLSEDDTQIIKGGLHRKGMDTLAFYKSKRHQAKAPFKGKWGIFYIKQGLDFLAHQISYAYPTFNDPSLLALNFLRSHEFFHFKADLQTLMFEAVTEKHIYVPLRIAMLGKETHFVEESLANRSVMKWAESSGINIGDFAHDFCKLQPNAYANFDLNPSNLKGEWLANSLDRLPPYCSPRVDIASWMDHVPTNLTKRSLCPEYIIFPTKLSYWISPSWKMPEIKNIYEDSKVLNSFDKRFRTYKKEWEKTKKMLFTNPFSKKLDFKRLTWLDDPGDCWSARVKDFRMHLRNEGGGDWTAYNFGSGDKLKHH